MKLLFKKLTPSATIPSYMHEGDSGMDVHSIETRSIGHEGCIHVFRTGIGAVIPEGYELQVRPRSGLACKHGVVAVLGTVDQGYRGEILVALQNNGHEHYLVKAGDRIAQLVLAPVARADIGETDDLGETERGADGFGSTGK